MKADTKKSTKPAAKSPVKVKDMAPKKDAKGGSTKSASSISASKLPSSSVSAASRTAL